MATNQGNISGRSRFVSFFSLIGISALIMLSLVGCGGGGGSAGDSATTPTVEAPGAPVLFTVEKTPEGVLSATLTWSPPVTGGAPVTFEIYRSTVAGTVFSSDNHLISIPVVTGQASYTFIDNAGLTSVETYWVVSAKNAGGETPTAEVPFKPIGPPSGGGDTGFGNNFAAALIFADNIGIGGSLITGIWTNDLATIDLNTGLRPLAAEVTTLLALTPPVTSLPYFDPLTTYVLNGVTYYKQQTPSTWQGQWEKGAVTVQEVTAKWGDNLISQKFTESSVIRIEMVLSKALTTPLKSYSMTSLYGTKANEIYGTSGSTYDNLAAFVFSSNARLKIQKLDSIGNPVGAPLYNQTLWNGDGPGFFAGEINVAGNFTYGFVWQLNKQVLPPDIPTKTGTWRLTFSLDADNSSAGKPVPYAVNNTSILTALNGVRISATEVYIDILVE